MSLIRERLKERQERKEKRTRENERRAKKKSEASRYTSPICADVNASQQTKPIFNHVTLRRQSAEAKELSYPLNDNLVSESTKE